MYIDSVLSLKIKFKLDFGVNFFKVKQKLLTYNQPIKPQVIIMIVIDICTIFFWWSKCHFWGIVYSTTILFTFSNMFWCFLNFFFAYKNLIDNYKTKRSIYQHSIKENIMVSMKYNMIITTFGTQLYFIPTLLSYFLRINAFLLFKKPHERNRLKPDRRC